MTGLFAKSNIDGEAVLAVVDDVNEYHEMMRKLGFRNELHIMILRQKFLILATADDEALIQPFINPNGNRRKMVFDMTKNEIINGI